MNMFKHFYMRFRHITNYRCSQWPLVLLIDCSFLPFFFFWPYSIYSKYFLLKRFDFLMLSLISWVLLLYWPFLLAFTWCPAEIRRKYTYILKSGVSRCVFYGDMIDLKYVHGASTKCQKPSNLVGRGGTGGVTKPLPSSQVSSPLCNN